jgi:hypothetical protein
MAEQICPTCGCLIAGEGYETGGVVFCCEPCAQGESCGYGCCDSAHESTPADEEQGHLHIRRP